MISEETKNSFLYHSYKQLKKNPIAVVSFFILCGYLLMALLASFGLIATDYSLVNNQNAYASSSSQYLFGTDIFGRNILSRAIHGTSTALAVGFFSTLLAMLIGISLGSLAGYFGGKVDDLVVWFYTTVDSIPYILLISAFAFILGQGLTNLYLALGLTSWVTVCRLVRGEFIKHKNREYVFAATAMGASHTRRIFLHILPNVFHITIIQFSLGFVQAIKLEVILSYLGLGVEPGTPSWGLMIDDAKLEIARGIWGNLTAATLFMFFLILSVNLFNDALRDALDPKLKT